MKVFLSGSKAVKSLPEKLTALLDEYCQQNCAFWVGDCAGTDILMQEYLNEKDYENVTVYVSGDCIRHKVDAFPVKHISVPDNVKGFAFYRQKDIAMEHDCDATVMLWDGKTRGTRCNIADVKRMRKPYTVILSEEERMDIYSYLNSKDVAEHCRKINHQFDAIGTAFIINACRHITLEEKLRLFQELIDTMPDEILSKKASRLKMYMKQDQDIETDSFHEALSFYIAAMRKDLNDFLTAEPDTVYSWVCWYRDWENGIDGNGLYSTFDAAKTALMQEIQDWNEDHSDISGFTGIICKRRINTKECCDAAINGNGLLTYLSDSGVDSYFFDYIWVKIPVPFKEGDLLYGTNPHRMSDMNIGKEPMVFVHGCYDDLDENNPKHRQRMAGRDASDMTAWGYWLDGNGRMYDECMHSYYDLEYYRGEIKGDVRVLKALSAHMKGEVDAHMLMIAYDALLREREMQAVFPGWDYMPECYEKCGIADIHEKYKMCRNYDREHRKA